jgi:hypothetical protein
VDVHPAVTAHPKPGTRVEPGHHRPKHGSSSGASVRSASQTSLRGAVPRAALTTSHRPSRLTCRPKMVVFVVVLAEHLAVVVRLGAEPVQPHPAVGSAHPRWAGPQDCGRSRSRPSPQARPRASSGRARSVRRRTSPVATSSTCSTDCSVPEAETW